MSDLLGIHDAASAGSSGGVLMQLTIGTCQFPIDRRIERNLAYVLDQMSAARAQGAVVAHFPETALSGYGGVEHQDLEELDWPILRAATERVQAHARELQMWAVLGSTHPLSKGRRPHNSVYVIDDQGAIIDRYDKRFLASNAMGQSGDVRHYTPGDHLVVFTIGSVRCGVFICHDFRYPELFRAYARLDVSLLFGSFHNGHCTAEVARARGRLYRTIVSATLQAAAASNYAWISATNTSRRHSLWPAFAVGPDGMITDRLRPGVAGVLISAVDTDTGPPDESAAWRQRALDGHLGSGGPVDDPRSRDRTLL